MGKDALDVGHPGHAVDDGACETFTGRVRRACLAQRRAGRQTLQPDVRRATRPTSKAVCVSRRRSGWVFNGPTRRRTLPARANPKLRV
jgi:hypothetical protein